MSREAPAEESDVLTVEELTEQLAEAVDATPKEIERGAEDIEIAPPEEATISGYGGRGFLNEPTDDSGE